MRGCVAEAWVKMAHSSRPLHPSEIDKIDTSKKTAVKTLTHESPGGPRLGGPDSNVFWPVGSTGKTCALRSDRRRALAVQREIGRAIFASLEYFRSNEAPHFCQYFPRESDIKKPRGRDRQEDRS